MPKKIAIMTAMPEEMEPLRALLQPKEIRYTLAMKVTSFPVLRCLIINTSFCFFWLNLYGMQMKKNLLVKSVGYGAGGYREHSFL